MNHNSFSKIWIIIIFVSFIGGGILIWQYSEIQNNKRETIEKTFEDETANWKIYRNEEYGFEVKYPQVYDKENYIECRPKIVEEKDEIIIFIGPLILKILDSQGLELFEYVNQYRKDWHQVQNFGSIENISIDGKDAVKIVSEFISANYSEPQDIFVKSKDKIYHFNYDDYILSNCLYEIDQLPSNIAEKMLSSFRFSKIGENKNSFIGFFENAELQYETEIQKENISTALNDILNLSEEQLKKRKYKDYAGKENQWDLPTLIVRHFVFEESYEHGMDDFYHNVKSKEVQNQVKKILEDHFK